MTEEKKMKVEFAPGAFDGFEGTQEELDELIAEVKAMFEGKTREEIESMGRPMDDDLFDDMSEEEQIRLMRSLGFDDLPPRNLQ
jgi:hypothetical protein